MRLIVTLVLSVLALTSCHSTNRFYGGGVAERQPQVSLESVTPIAGSPGRGFPTAHFPLPIFPRELVRAGVAGEVVVRLVADKDGRVTDASIIKSSQRELEAPVLSATKLWRFQEFLDLSVRERTGLIVDCLIKFSFLED